MCIPLFVQFPVAMPDVNIDIVMVWGRFVAKYSKVGQLDTHVGRMQGVHISHSN
jgi:hypothetical protein